MDGGISRMHRRIRDGSDPCLVVGSWHDNGKMAMSTATMSGVDGTGICIVELTVLEDLQ